MNTQLSNDQKLNAFKSVNDCETFDELILAVKLIASLTDNIILGKTKNYPIENLLRNLKLIRQTKGNYRLVTREYGIRQQVIYLHHYGEE